MVRMITQEDQETYGIISIKEEDICSDQGTANPFLSTTSPYTLAFCESALTHRLALFVKNRTQFIRSFFGCHYPLIFRAIRPLNLQLIVRSE